MVLFIITGCGSKTGRGVKHFGPLEDQQCLTSIRRSELLVGHAISLNKRNVPIGGRGNNFWSDKNIWTHLGGSLTSNWATSQMHPLPPYDEWIAPNFHAHYYWYVAKIWTKKELKLTERYWVYMREICHVVAIF